MSPSKASKILFMLVCVCLFTLLFEVMFLGCMNRNFAAHNATNKLKFV